MHDLVRDLPRRDVSWPADHCGHAHATLHDGVVEASPGSCASAPGPASLGTVVRHPHDDRVVADSQSVDRIQHQTRVVIDVGERIADVTRTGLPRVVWMRKGWKVDVGDGVVEEEGRSRTDAAFHELDTLQRGLPVEGAAALEVEDFDLMRRAARFAFPDVGRWCLRRIVARHRGSLCLVTGMGNAIPLVESLVRRLAFAEPIVFTAEVPLSIVTRRVAQRLEGFCDRHLPLRDSAALDGSGPHRISTGKKSGPRDHARVLNVEVGQAHAFRGETIDAWRRDTSNASVHADLTPSQVVGQHDDDIGALHRRGLGRLDRAGAKEDDRHQERASEVTVRH